MDLNKFEDEMKALAVCVKCLDESKPRKSLLWCSSCRMVLYCSAAHQKEHWRDHKAFCRARKKAAAASAPAPQKSDGWVPPLPSPRGPSRKDECETYISICDATGVFSILGMFWRSGKASRLCNLMVKLGKGPTSCFHTKLLDWEPRTRLAALKTLTVQGSADYVRVTTGMAACLTQRALDEWQAIDLASGGKGSLPGAYKAAAANFLFEVFEVPGGGGGGVDNCGLGEYLASEAHASFKKSLVECCDDGDSLDVFFFGLLNERREFRDCYSFLEGLAKCGGAESYEKALHKLAEQGDGDIPRVTAALCDHACLCFHLAGLPGTASSMHIAKEGCEQNFEESPFAKAMLYRTAFENTAGETVPHPRPELSEQYKELVWTSLQKAQEATGQSLVELTPVSVEIKTLLEQEILL
eukprot:jgi/Undpi1/10454/HiC_scaffold_29.g12904.m1